MIMTTTTKLIVRIWLALTSAAAFVFGWGLLAHAPKAEASSQPELAAPAVHDPAAPGVVQLAPVPSLEQLRSGAQVSGAPAPSIRFSTVQSAPRLRTRGS
jgi:hypothetical protein